MVEQKSDKGGKWTYTEDTAKVVAKPWGKEVWINYRQGENVGDEEKKYVMKKLYIKKGTRTSFQYHEEKIETNFLIEGSVKAFFENEDAEIEEKIIESGGIWSIPNGRKHRIECMTDIILMESSTPEVDDVVRIKDDTGRGDGRIHSEHN